MAGERASGSSESKSREEQIVPGGSAGPARADQRAEDGFTLQGPRGTHDILPPESDFWQIVEENARLCFCRSGYKEIRLPIFEHTDLFKRGVGETTDIVNKEMYTFKDKSERSLTLRPEGTAGVVRAFLNGGMHRASPPVKLFYLGPMFRYESTKTGRQRQFNQIGVEAFGSAGPLIDAEVILVALDYLKIQAVKDLELQLNSIGCPVCRPLYREKLKETLAPRLSQLCADCRDRFERNPLRMLDCKSKHCQSHYQNVPLSIDFLCQDCNLHWQELKGLLTDQNVPYTVNTRLVRGLDYYTRTVFEIVTRDPRLAVESTVLAGGRYDNLVEMFGGPPTPAVGWALGVERLLILSDKSRNTSPSAFVVSSNPSEALKLALALRQENLSCELDFPQSGSPPRSFSKQLQQANKAGATWTLILGDDELASGDVTLKDMKSGSQERISRNDLSRLLKNKIRETEPESLPGQEAKD